MPAISSSETRDVGRPVAHQHPGLHLAPRRLVERAQRAVEAHHAPEIHADARSVQHHGAAEAVADGRHAAGIDAGMTGERTSNAAWNRAVPDIHVPQHGVHQGTRAFGVGGSACPSPYMSTASAV